MWDFFTIFYVQRLPYMGWMIINVIGVIKSMMGNIGVARKTELTYNCLETRVELCQERGLILQCQDSFLNHGALHIIILDHHVFFQDFDCIELLCALPVRQHHLQDRETAAWKSPRAGREGHSDA